MNLFLRYFALLLFSLTVANALSEIINNENSKDQYNYKIKFIEVPLDHFNYVTNHTFMMRYLVNDSYIDPNNELNSPILFYTGNEGDIELFAQNTGFMWDAAKRLKALIIFAEHRYYGKSLPFGNKTFDTITNFGYLTAEQALADYAHLLQNIMAGKNRRPVIAIGGSYGGMLAAWFRIKYPHFITGALASSAPVLQFPGLTPCDVFSRIVTSVFSTAYTRNCSTNIKKSWDILKNLSMQDKGRSFLNTQFNFCKNLTKADDLDKFFDYLEDVYGNLAMANYPYEANFLAPLPAYPVRMFCGQLAKLYSKNEELIIALQKAINIYANYTGKTKCLDYNSAYQPSLASDVWEFQSCTEMVMPMCSGRNDMFMEKKWDIKKYSDDCFKKFGVRPKEYEMITRFGGDNMNSISNIIFSNGLLDPWSGGGVLRTSNSKIAVLIIPEGAHHIDLRSKNDNDPRSVQQAREIELKYIQSWINEFYM